MQFIRINNRKNFLITEVPEHHPQSVKYLQWWKAQKKRCIEGYWSVDDAEYNIDPTQYEPDPDNKQYRGSWRYIPPQLYFYVNFGTIMHKPEDAPKAAPKKRIRPYLRDVEWEFFYSWLEARGFSGFMGDDEFSCNRDILDYHKDSDTEVHPSCINSKGKLKKYISARTYLRQLHEKPLGPPLYENEARNFFMLGSRGFGKSYMVGDGVVTHELLFDGAKYYNEDSIKDPFKVEIFVGAALSSKSSDLLSKARECIENLPGAWGEGTKEYVPPPFEKQLAGVWSPNNMKNPVRHEYQKKTGGSWKKYGSGSNIKHGIYTVENPEAAAGTRPGVMVVEEVGLLPNVLAVHGSNTACQMDGTVKFGSTIYLGTGGNVEKIQESEIIFRDPEGFDFISFDDTYESSGKIGWFVPVIYSYNQFKDENGNTDVERATAFAMKRREKARKAKDPSALALEMMNYPLVPSEMFLNAHGAMFPQAELKEHKAYVVTNPHSYENTHYYGELTWTSEGKLKWEHADNSGEVVTEWPIKNNKNKPGIIQIREMPKRNSAGEVHPGRYIQGTDTYDDDESVTNSLGSTIVFDMWTNRIVAEYTGRRGAKEFYEITRKLNIFYRAVHNYEKNKKGLYTYYDIKKSTHLLCDTPESLKDIADITISRVGNQAKGTNATKQVNAYGLRLILDWLLEVPYGEPGDSEKMNLHTLWYVGIIDELMNYNPEIGNYDRISALIMVMILKEELSRNAMNRQKKRIKSLADDPFFSRNYREPQFARVI